MATAIPFEMVFQTTSGLPVSGVKVYVYVPTTTTPRTAYSDTGLSVPIANPFEGNAAGYVAFYLSSDLGYRIVAKSADDSITYYDQEHPSNVSGAQPVDATLTALAALTIVDDGYIQGTGSDTFRVRYIQRATYAALTAIAAADRFDGMRVYVSARATAGDGAEGWWRFDSASATSADGGTVLAPNAGTGRWFRIGLKPTRLEWFGSDTAAIASAITAAGAGGHVVIPNGSYSLTAKLTLLASQIFEGLGEVTLTKAFNGDMIEAGAVGTQIKNIRCEGDGANFTGAGVTYTTAGNGYQYTEDLWVLNTAGAPLKFATADAGQKSSHYWGIFRCFTSTLHGIELPTSGTETVGDREFFDCSGDGSPLIKFGKGIVTRVVGGNCTGFDFSNSAGVSLRASIIGARIATSGVSITVDGNDSIIQACQIAGGLTLTTSASRNIIGPNNHATGSTVADNSGVGGTDANRLFDGHQTFTPTWGADSGGAPVLGNGTLTGALTHNGRSIRATVSWEAGSTTTFGGGVWTFTLPAGFTAKTQTHGSAQALDTGTALLTAIPVMAAGSNVVRLIATSGGGTGTANNIGPTIPITWANGDTLSFTIEFDRG
jgi:hypothetical protein